MLDVTRPVSQISFNNNKNTPPLALQERSITPTTEEQIIVGDDGYNLSKVTVAAVTKDIDNNIQSSNIKSGVSILGVEGVLAGNKLPEVLNKTVTSLTAGDLYGVTHIPEKSFYLCRDLISVELPESLIEIQTSAFAECNNIESDINLPNSLESIQPKAFNNCNKISGDLIISSNIKKIYSDTFYNCNNIQNVYIGENVEGIESQAFYRLLNCKNLIFAPNSKLSKIGDWSFYYLSNNTENGIDEVIIPPSVTEIGMYCFQYSNIKKITISASNIETGAFWGCELTSVIISSKITSIGNAAFWGCNKLITMRVEATTPPTLVDTDSISSATTQIQVPMESVEAYKTATNWSNFADIIVGYTE